MNAERWQAIGELFEQALPLPSASGRPLDGACGVDQELRREVVSLLASHRRRRFLQHRIEKALASFHDTSVAGTQPVRVGPCRLIRELGRGGMGTVFLAERDDDEYYAQVAVKLGRPGMDIEFILARFRRERRPSRACSIRTSAACSTAAPPRMACPTSSWSTSMVRG